MNIALIIMILWNLETSKGKNLNHPGSHCFGHLGFEQVVIDDLNNRAGYCKYRIADTMDKHTAFKMAREHISNYRARLKTPTDVFLFWRAGIKGMKNPTSKQLLYTARGLSQYMDMLQKTDAQAASYGIKSN